MGIEGYLVSPAVFKTVEGGVPALVSSILTCPRQKTARAQRSAGGFSYKRHIGTDATRYSFLEKKVQCGIKQAENMSFLGISHEHFVNVSALLLTVLIVGVIIGMYQGGREKSSPAGTDMSCEMEE